MGALGGVGGAGIGVKEGALQTINSFFQHIPAFLHTGNPSLLTGHFVDQYTNVYGPPYPTDGVTPGTGFDVAPLDHVDHVRYFVQDILPIHTAPVALLVASALLFGVSMWKVNHRNRIIPEGLTKSQIPPNTSDSEFLLED